MDGGQREAEKKFMRPWRYHNLWYLPITIFPRRKMAMANEQSVIPVERIENIIIQIKGQKVIIDADLAKIYGVTTKKLNQAVKRNTWKKREKSYLMFENL